MEGIGSIITTLGAGSGIDMVELANNLALAQFQSRNDRLTLKSETLERQISLASSLKNAFSILTSSLGDRVRVGDLASVPLIANSGVASVSSPIGISGGGSYSLEVSQLADSQSLAGPVMASAEDPVGAGSLTIRFGTISGATFTADAARDTVEVTIDSGSSLTDIAGAINASGSGVTAYIAQTTGGPRLMLKGEEGAANGFVIEAAETPGEEGLAALAWEPVAGDPARLTGIARDALFELDGLAMTSTSNNTGEIAPGLKLQLSGINVGNPTQITFSNPSSSIQTAMQDLVGALNEITGDLRAATNSLAGGELSSDPGARALRQRFSRLAGEVIMPNAAADAPRTLSDLGLAIQRDGSFRIDTDRLQATLERDPEGAAAMFTTGLFGVYSTFEKLSRNVSSSADPGSLAGSIARYERQAIEVTERASTLAEKQETLRLSMISRFAKADVRIAASQSTLSFLQAQIDAWNSSGN